LQIKYSVPLREMSTLGTRRPGPPHAVARETPLPSLPPHTGLLTDLLLVEDVQNQLAALIHDVGDGDRSARMLHGQDRGIALLRNRV